TLPSPPVTSPLSLHDALPISVAYAGQPFFKSALAALRAGRTNMDVPISLAVILASGMSLAETIRSGQHVYFDASVSLLFFLLIRSEEHTSELQSRENLVCRLL